jgi:hypothetical protein
MAMKCSERRAILRRAQLILNQLINANENAARLETELTNAGVPDVSDSVQKVLDAGGPSVTDDTISKEMINVLDGTTVDPVHGAIDWTYEAE